MTTAVVTGAFGYTGRHITARLLERGVEVRTLTNDTGVDPLRAAVEASPLRFDDFEALVSVMRGADVLYNTYWVRFPRGGTSFASAVANSTTLFTAARQAGVGRIVHISISNAFTDPTLGYFRGKAEVERALEACGVSYGIVRPTVMFGGSDIFINNIAWILRHLPFFAVPGPGGYELQPVYVGDVADLCLRVADERSGTVVDAAGPDVLSFIALLRAIRDAIGTRSVFVSLPPRVALALSRIVGWAVRDVVVTKGELVGLMRELIVSKGEPTGPTSFRAWLAEHGSELGRSYASELSRNYRRERPIAHVG
jgi:uncharacterized protein YbjT (DUF2867 family)